MLIEDAAWLPPLTRGSPHEIGAGSGPPLHRSGLRSIIHPSVEPAAFELSAPSPCRHAFQAAPLSPASARSFPRKSAPRKAYGQRLHRGVQQPAEAGVPECVLVRVNGGRPFTDQCLEGRLQPRPTAHEPGKLDAEAVRGPTEPRPKGRIGTGSREARLPLRGIRDLADHRDSWPMRDAIR